MSTLNEAVETVKDQVRHPWKEDRIRKEERRHSASNDVAVIKALDTTFFRHPQPEAIEKLSLAQQIAEVESLLKFYPDVYAHLALPLQLLSKKA